MSSPPRSPLRDARCWAATCYSGGAPKGSSQCWRNERLAPTGVAPDPDVRPLLGRMTSPLADICRAKSKLRSRRAARPLRRANKPVTFGRWPAKGRHRTARALPGTAPACAPEVAGLSQWRGNGRFLALQQRSSDVRSEPRRCCGRSHPSAVVPALLPAVPPTAALAFALPTPLSSFRPPWPTVAPAIPLHVMPAPLVPSAVVLGDPNEDTRSRLPQHAGSRSCADTCSGKAQRCQCGRDKDCCSHSLPLS